MLVFIHINKSAGRTFTHMLRSSYGLRHCQVEPWHARWTGPHVLGSGSAAIEEALLQAQGHGASDRVERSLSVEPERCAGRPPAHSPPHALRGRFPPPVVGGARGSLLRRHPCPGSGDPPNRPTRRDTRSERSPGHDGAGGVRAWRHALSSELEFDGAPVRRIGTDRPLEVVVREVKTAIRDAVADDLPCDADR
jgi:hypothetical protein